MNPLKCYFRVTTEKFLGHLITKSSIQANSTKVKTMLEMPNPANLKELKGLRGRLAYIKQFITNLSGKSLRFAKLMKTGVTFEWNKKMWRSLPRFEGIPFEAPNLDGPYSWEKVYIICTSLRSLNGGSSGSKEWAKPWNGSILFEQNDDKSRA